MNQFAVEGSLLNSDRFVKTKYSKPEIRVETMSYKVNWMFAVGQIRN